MGWGGGAGFRNATLELRIHSALLPFASSSFAYKAHSQYNIMSRHVQLGSACSRVWHTGTPRAECPILNGRFHVRCVYPMTKIPWHCGFQSRQLTSRPAVVSLLQRKCGPVALPRQSLLLPSAWGTKWFASSDARKSLGKSRLGAFFRAPHLEFITHINVVQLKLN